MAWRWNPWRLVTGTGMVAAALAGLLLAPGCSRQSEWAGPQYGSTPAAARTGLVYRFAVHPLYSPGKLAKDYQPLMNYLNSRVAGVQFELESSRDYGTFEAKYRARGPQFILANPWQALDAMKVGYRVLAMAGDASDFRGTILVRRDGGIRSVQDLRGKVVAYPAPTALAACMMPQLFFLDHGLDPMKALVNRFVGSQESSILNVYEGLAAAGCTWPPPWRAFQREHPREASELRVAFETESLVNNAVMAREDVDETLAAQVRQGLVNLGSTGGGRAILKNMETSRFTPASGADYDVVRSFVGIFELRVRPADRP